MEFLSLAALLLVIALAWSRLRRIEADADALRSRVGYLEDMLRRQQLGPASAPESEIAPAETVEVAPAIDEPFVYPEAVPAEPIPALASPPPRESLEQRLTSRWLVWVGGLALAMGGVFLAKYSVEHGLLGPGLRAALGIAAGLAMLIAGETLVGKTDPGFAAVRASYVPSALSAGGIVTLFATLYAAYALAGLISGLPAFAGLALTAAIAILISPRHGPFMAVLGLGGALVVPLLIDSDDPSTAGLFLYLALVISGALGVARVRAWAWLGWIALSGAALWLALRLSAPFDRFDAIVFELFLAVLLGLFLLFRNGVPGISWLGPSYPVERQATWLARAAVHAAVAFSFLLVMATQAEPAATAAFLLFAAGVMVLGRWQADFDDAPFTAAILGCLLLAAKARSLPGLIPPEWPQPLLLTDYGFLAIAGTLTAIMAVGGFALLWGATRPGRFAAVSAVTPVAVLAIAYWRFANLVPDPAWAGGALALTALQLAAAERLGPWRQSSPALKAALAAYAVGAVAALALGAAMVLREVWLTVILSALLPCIGWIYARLHVAGLRLAAFAVAAVVVIRLVANPYVLDYPVQSPLFGWVLYGYGLPALAFVLALRLFRRGGDGPLIGLLEAGAIALTALLTTFTIRLVATGGLDAESWEFGERATQTVNWLGIGVGLLAYGARRGRPVQVWAGRLLVSWATLHGSIGLLLFNPALTGESVGRWIAFDLLTVAYAAPAILYALLWRHLSRAGWRKLAFIVAAWAVLFGFTWATLEVTHAFRGEFLDAGMSSDAEWYAYSVAWLCLGAILIGLGIRTRSAGLRHAGLVLTLAAVLKVFLFDMADLDGLYRAASFMGLGGALVGIGYLYRRYLSAPPASAPPQA